MMTSALEMSVRHHGCPMNLIDEVMSSRFRGSESANARQRPLYNAQSSRDIRLT